MILKFDKNKIIIKKKKISWEDSRFHIRRQNVCASKVIGENNGVGPRVGDKMSAPNDVVFEWV